MAVRRYTGTSDIKGKVSKKKPGTESMVNFLSYCFGMKSVGTVTSESSLSSVHASARGFDIRAWDFEKNDWATSNFEERNWNLMHYLHTNRDYLGIEEIHDYCGIYVWGTMVRYDGSGRGSNANYGAGYRCNRDNVQEAFAPTGWKRWTLEAHKSHGGDSVGLKHIHVEISPASADNKTQLESKLSISINRYFTNNWHSVVLIGSGSGAYALGTPVNKSTPIGTGKIKGIIKRL